MATLYITECQFVGQAGVAGASTLSEAQVIAPYMPPLAEQSVAIGVSSAQSSAFQAATTFVMVNCDAACSLAWGANPSAVASAQRLAANETRFYAVTPGSRLAVIQNS